MIRFLLLSARVITSTGIARKTNERYKSALPPCKTDGIYSSKVILYFCDPVITCTAKCTYFTLLHVFYVISILIGLDNWWFARLSYCRTRWLNWLTINVHVSLLNQRLHTCMYTNNCVCVFMFSPLLCSPWYSPLKILLKQLFAFSK